MPLTAHGRTLPNAPSFSKPETHRLPHPCPSLGKGWDQPIGAHGTISPSCQNACPPYPSFAPFALRGRVPGDAAPRSWPRACQALPMRWRRRLPHPIAYISPAGGRPRSMRRGAITRARPHARSATNLLRNPTKRWRCHGRQNRRPIPSVLRNHADLHFQSGPYNYSLTTTAGKTTYSVTDGKQTISHDLEWAFGAGSLGQTYVYQQGEKFYESQVSFYSGIEGLDITTGHSRDIPENLETAAGRHM